LIFSIIFLGIIALILLLGKDGNIEAERIKLPAAFELSLELWYFSGIFLFVIGILVLIGSIIAYTWMGYYAFLSLFLLALCFWSGGILFIRLGGQLRKLNIRALTLSAILSLLLAVGSLLSILTTNFTPRESHIGPSPINVVIVFSLLFIGVFIFYTSIKYWEFFRKSLY